MRVFVVLEAEASATQAENPSESGCHGQAITTSVPTLLDTLSMHLSGIFVQTYNLAL